MSSNSSYLDAPTSQPPAAPKVSGNNETESASSFPSSLSSLVLQIVVEQRRINMGQDLKFDEDPFSAHLNGLMKSEEYRVAISKINEVILIFNNIPSYFSYYFELTNFLIYESHSFIHLFVYSYIHLFIYSFYSFLY